MGWLILGGMIGSLGGGFWGGVVAFRHGYDAGRKAGREAALWDAHLKEISQPEKLLTAAQMWGERE